MPAATPRRRLNFKFVRAVGASPIRNSELAKRAGFAQAQQFSSLIHAQFVSVSPRTHARLRIVAYLIGFEGPIFLDEELPAVATPDAFGLESLPEPRSIFNLHAPPLKPGDHVRLTRASDIQMQAGNPFGKKGGQ